MKKLFLITITIFTLQVTAQKPEHHKQNFMKDLSAEQVANLRTKKMTLHLDLSKAQQNKIYKLNLDLATERKLKVKDTSVKPSADERYQRQLVRLDKQIAIKQKMKVILDANQFEKWEKMKMNKHRKSRRRGRKKNKS